jgi:hypothetical protein
MNVSRSLRDMTAAAKTRLHAVTAATALAFIAGLSGPAAAAFADPPTTDAPASVQNTTVHQASEAVANAITAKIGGNPVQPAAPAAAPKPGTWASVDPSAADLWPQGKAIGQSDIGLSDDQLRNARTIVQVGQQLGLQPRAWVIALSTSLQESKLTNLGDLGAANDHDSLGLFQQRPASGWGSPAQLDDPTYAATAFYKALEQVPGWQGMSVTDAAQAVQVSAFGDRYAQWEQQAGDIVSGLYGYGPYASSDHNLK